MNVKCINFNYYKNIFNKIMPRFKFKFPLLFEADYELDVDKNDIKVAWNIYCELQTRVGIVSFKEEEDIISICFESWYDLFKVVRNNLKDLNVPLKKAKVEETTKNLDEILFSLLNNHIRPFLRKWHYKFDSYWNENFAKDKNPIEVQKRYPNYKELIKDIELLEKKLKEILDALELIVRWNKRKYLKSRFYLFLKISISILIICTFLVLYITFLIPVINLILPT